MLRRTGPAALESTDFTARIVLTDLPADQRIFYRVDVPGPRRPARVSEPDGRQLSHAADAPRPGATSTLAWSADTVGQGWGINPDWGGLRLYETMQRAEPDLFIHCGDTIYADGVARRRK